MFYSDLCFKETFRYFVRSQTSLYIAVVSDELADICGKEDLADLGVNSITKVKY